jgi:hypothetical protein
VACKSIGEGNPYRRRARLGCARHARLGCARHGLRACARRIRCFSECSTRSSLRFGALSRLGRRLAMRRRKRWL